MGRATGRGASATCSTRVAAALALVAAIVVTGCSRDDLDVAGEPAGAEDPIDAPPAVAPGSGSTTDTPTTGPTPTAPVSIGPGPTAPATTVPPTRPITIALAGDTYAEGVDDVVVDMGRRLDPMTPVLRAADIAFLNLETALTTGGTAEPKQFTFRAEPRVLEALAWAGIDGVSMANNHGMDFGEEGLRDSLAARAAAPFPVIGIGADADAAFAPAYYTVAGTKVAIVAATHVLDGSLQERWTATDAQPGLASAYDRERLLATVEEAALRNDVVVVFLHWGREGDTCPSASQTAIGAELSFAGADAVVGSHAHRLMGGGYRGQAYLHYGLGNFAFDAHSAAGARTGVLELTFAGGRVVADRWIPGVIRDATPTPLEGAEAESALATWRAQIGCTGLSPVPG